jgi:hypothetical protein
MSRRYPRLVGCLLIVLVAVFLGASALLAQAPAQTGPAAVAGKFKGTATTPDGDVNVIADLTYEGGRFGGVMQSDSGPLTVNGGTLEGDKLTLTGELQGNPIVISGTFKDGKFTGQWLMGEQTGAVVLVKDTGAPAAATTAAVAAAPAAAVVPAAAGAADDLSGDWDGIVDMGDQPQSFSLKLKTEGEKLAGEIGSPAGLLPLENGKWANGALTATFSFNGSPVTMTGALKEGKLVGIFDIGGQGQIGWAAIKVKK